MRSLIDIILLLLNWYTYLIIAMAILSWLVAFDVINFRNNIVRQVWGFLEAVTEPALRPIRRFLPNLGGIDVSPVILLLIILFIQKLIVEYAVAQPIYMR
ncbi:YggT family protein [Lichenibacterium ramalinae]|uniref:YggT family protein n=1 Tax=Lichenibacterium ramalinae TaxID=2316527 RepID=A0A4Q2RJQ0_9HYPH|nr:YggT family protein [Lichenibacterium ramalinae]RYB07782.1 YggT family protein [Lichenibacterium ramalinae]